MMCWQRGKAAKTLPFAKADSLSYATDVKILSRHNANLSLIFVESAPCPLSDAKPSVEVRNMQKGSKYYKPIVSSN